MINKGDRQAGIGLGSKSSLRTATDRNPVRRGEQLRHKCDRFASPSRAVVNCSAPSYLGRMEAFVELASVRLIKTRTDFAPVHRSSDSVVSYARTGPSKRVLFIGGTHFSWRCLVKKLVDRDHGVLLFNRGSKLPIGDRSLIVRIPSCPRTDPLLLSSTKCTPHFKLVSIEA